MTRELSTPESTTVAQSLNMKQTQTVEKINLKESPIRIINEDRFKRYKKHLQRRAGNIL